MKKQNKSLLINRFAQHSISCGSILLCIIMLISCVDSGTNTTVNESMVFTTTFDEETIAEGDEFQFQFAAEDPKGDELLFSLIVGGEIENASITREGLFTFNPDYGQAAGYDFTVQVSNGELTDEHVFKVIVEPVNRPPVFTTTFDEESIDEGDEFQFQFEAEDPDDDQLMFSLINGNDIENASITTDGLFTFNPEAGQAGIYDFTVRVSDGDLSDEHNFEIAVESESNPKVEKGVEFNNQFSIPDDLKVTCMSGETEPVFTNALICDVMVWGDHTYWALSYIDNWTSMAIVAVNPEGEIVQRWDRDGARYLWKIILDNEAETATFVGQSEMSFTMNWDDLRVE